MGKVALQMYLSLDGVMEAPEKWEGPFWSDELEQYALEQVLAADALLLGRATYEIFASSWPSRSGDDFSDRMNSMPKFVVSKTLKAPEWNATVIDGDVVEEVSKLKQQSGQDLLIYASGELVRPLMHMVSSTTFDSGSFPWSWEAASVCSERGPPRLWNSSTRRRSRQARLFSATSRSRRLKRSTPTRIAGQGVSRVGDVPNAFENRPRRREVTRDSTQRALDIDVTE